MSVYACNVANSVINTGVECNEALGPTAQLWAIAPSVTFTAAQMLDIVNTLNAASHAAPAQRCYPLFGYTAPIFTLTDNDEDDVIETSDFGQKIFVRGGFANRTYETTAGGLCFAKALRSFQNAGFSFIEVDAAGNYAAMLTPNGTYTGFPFFGGGLSPKAATAKTVFKNRFSISYNVDNYVNNGVVFAQGAGLLALNGLINTDLVIGNSGVSSTTKLKFQVLSDCAKTDLTAKFPSALPMVTNFVVTADATGAAVTISAAAIVGNHVELTGTFTSGQSYDVSLALASVLYTNGVIGYDGTLPVTSATGVPAAIIIAIP